MACAASCGRTHQAKAGRPSIQHLRSPALPRNRRACEARRQLCRDRSRLPPGTAAAGLLHGVLVPQPVTDTWATHSVNCVAAACRCGTRSARSPVTASTTIYAGGHRGHREAAVRTEGAHRPASHRHHAGRTSRSGRVQPGQRLGQHGPVDRQVGQNRAEHQQRGHRQPGQLDAESQLKRRVGHKQRRAASRQPSRGHRQLNPRSSVPPAQPVQLAGQQAGAAGYHEQRGGRARHAVLDRKGGH